MPNDRHILVDLNDHRSRRFTSRPFDATAEVLDELSARYSVSEGPAPATGSSGLGTRVVLVRSNPQGQPIEVAYDLIRRWGFFPAWADDTSAPSPTGRSTAPSIGSAFDDQEITPVLYGPTAPRRPGDGIVIGIVEVGGLDCSDPEVGGTGNPEADRLAVRAGTHPKILPFVDRKGDWIDPFERPDNATTTHGDMTVRCAAGRPIDSARPLGTAPYAKVCFVRKRHDSEIAEAIDELGNQPFRVDIISLSHDNPYSRSRAVDEAVARGTVVVESLGSNILGPITIPPPGRSITVGAYDVATQSAVTSYGPGLCLRATHDLKPGIQSSAVPVVAGVAALLLQKNRGWTPFDVFRALTQTAFKPPRMNGAVFTEKFGWGLLRAAPALALQASQLLPMAPISITWSLIPGTRDLDVNWVLRKTANESGSWLGLFRDPDTTGLDRTPEVEQTLSAGQTYARISFTKPGRWRVVIRSLGLSGTRSEVLPSTILPPLSNPPFMV